MVSLRLVALAFVALAFGGCLAAEEGTAPGMRVLYTVYKQCEDSEDPIVCLKARAVKLVDRALHSDAIQLVDGISLIKRAESERSLKTELEPLPSDLEARANKVDDLLWNRVGAFMESHSVQINMPTFINDLIYENEDGEGRGKKKRLIPAILMGLLLKGSMLAMAMKGLALLAAKALLVSKLALVLAGIIALKKLFSSGHEKTTYEIVKQPIVSHSHEYSSSHEGYEGGYGRSLDAEVPHRLAYRAYKQQKQQQEQQPNMP